PPLEAAALRGREQRDVVLGRPRVTPVAERAALVALRQFLVALAHHPEGVVVEAQPDMQAVLLDASMVAAAGRALAAEAPALLIDGDLVAAAVFGVGKLPGRRHGGAASSDHGDLHRSAFHPPLKSPWQEARA